jgi:hypothetical protein
VLFRYDIENKQLEKKAIGSYMGHISRNVIATSNGHVFVPRVANEGSDFEAKYRVELVELDSALNELGANPISHYPVSKDSSSHGIVAFARLENGDTVFTTSSGRLYLIKDEGKGTAALEDIGFIHPTGESYTACLFCLDGVSTVIALSSKREGGPLEWIILDLKSRKTRIIPFEIANKPEHGVNRLLLYGSNTRDDRGDIYVGGCYQNDKGTRQFPILLRVKLQLMHNETVSEQR